MVRNQLEPEGVDDLHMVQRVVRAGGVDNGGSKQGSPYKKLQKSAGFAWRKRGISFFILSKLTSLAIDYKKTHLLYG